MDTHYTASPETTGNLIPEFRDIRLADVRVLDGGKIILDGYDASRPLDMACNDVVFDDPKAIVLSAQHVTLTRGPGPSNLAVSGEDVKLTGSTTDAPATACASGSSFRCRDARRFRGRAAHYAAIVDAQFTRYRRRQRRPARRPFARSAPR